MSPTRDSGDLDSPPRDAQGAHDDVDARAILDAAVAQDADASDGAVVDATCEVEAGRSGTCTGEVCTTDAGSFLALAQDTPWNVGGLDWTASRCTDPLGWPVDFTHDRKTLLFALGRTDQAAFMRGTPAFVYWGAPDAPPNADAELCSVRVDAPLPRCPTGSGTP